jgi:muconolactone D-isomerase
MLFHVRMNVRIPLDFDTTRLDELKRVERERSQALQKEGKWKHIWRIAGQYSNISLFDVADPQELHDIVSSLPLYAFMEVSVTALCRHPSSIRGDDS